MKNKRNRILNLLGITVLYLLIAAAFLYLFQVSWPSDPYLQYTGQILSGLITMFGIYIAFADSERDRDIENKPRFSASISTYNGRNKPYVYFAGRDTACKTHLRIDLHNEGSTEINILGILIGKQDSDGKVCWVPFRAYQYTADPVVKKNEMTLFRENMDINASLETTVDVADKRPCKSGIENHHGKHKNRFILEIWYTNDYSDTHYVKQYSIEHIPLEHYTPEQKEEFDQALKCHAYKTEEKTAADYRKQLAAAEQFEGMVRSQYQVKEEE